MTVGALIFFGLLAVCYGAGYLIYRVLNRKELRDPNFWYYCNSEENK